MGKIAIPVTRIEYYNDSFVVECLAKIWYARRKSMDWRKNHVIIKCSGCGGVVVIFTKKQFGNWYWIGFLPPTVQYCKKCQEEKIFKKYHIDTPTARTMELEEETCTEFPGFIDVGREIIDE